VRVAAVQFAEVVRQVNLLWSRRMSDGGRATPRGVMISAGMFVIALIVLAILGFQNLVEPVRDVVAQVPDDAATMLRAIALLAAPFMATAAIVPNLLQRPTTTDLGTLLRVLPVDRALVTQALSFSQSVIGLAMSLLLASPLLALALAVTPPDRQAAVLVLGVAGVMVTGQWSAVVFGLAEGALRRWRIPLHLARSLAAASTFAAAGAALGPLVLVVGVDPGAVPSALLDGVIAAGPWWIGGVGLVAIAASWQVRAAAEAWSQEVPATKSLRTGVGLTWPASPAAVAVTVETLALIRAPHVVSPLIFTAGATVVIASLSGLAPELGRYWHLAAPSFPVLAALGGVHSVGLSQKWRWQRGLLGGVQPHGWGLAAMAAHLAVTLAWVVVVVPLAVWASGEPSVAAAILAALPTVFLAAVASLVAGAVIVSPPEEPLSALAATLAALPVVAMPSLAESLVPGGGGLGVIVRWGTAAALIAGGLVGFPRLVERVGVRGEPRPRRSRRGTTPHSPAAGR